MTAIRWAAAFVAALSIWGCSYHYDEQCPDHIAGAHPYADGC